MHRYAWIVIFAAVVGLAPRLWAGPVQDNEAWKPTPSKTYIAFQIERPRGLPPGEAIEVLVEATARVDEDTLSAEALFFLEMSEPQFLPVASQWVRDDSVIQLPLPTDANRVQVKVRGPHILEQTWPLRNVEAGRPPIRLRPNLASRVVVKLDGMEALRSAGIDIGTIEAWVGVDRTPSKFRPYPWRRRLVFNSMGCSLLEGVPQEEGLRLVKSETDFWAFGPHLDPTLPVELESQVQPANRALDWTWSLRANPLAGWRVPLQDALGQPVRGVFGKAIAGAATRITLDESGDLLVFGLPGAQVSLELSGYAYASQRLDLAPFPKAGQIPTMDPVRLAGHPPVSGRVLWPDGTPCADFPVHITERSVDSATTVVTDSKGNFQHTGVASPAVLVFGEVETHEQVGDDSQGRPSRPRYLLLPRWVKAGSRTPDLTLVPTREVAINVRYTDGTAPTTVRVMAQNPDLSGIGWYPKPTTLPAHHGVVTWDGLPEGRWRIFVSTSRSKQVSQTITVGAGLEAPSFVLERTCLVTGQVFDAAGQAVRNASVWVEGSSRTKTNAQGEFRLWHVPQGQHVLHARHGSQTAERSVSLHGPTAHAHLSLRSPKGQTIPFRVMEQHSGEPLAGVWVVLGEGNQARSWTNLQGLLRVGPVEPGWHHVRMYINTPSPHGFLSQHEVYSGWVEASDKPNPTAEQVIRVSVP